MAGSGASAVRLADRSYQLSLAGLMATGYLALAGSGSLTAASAAIAGLGSVGAFLLFRALAAKHDRFYAGIQILACLELLSAALISVNLSFFLYLAAFLLFLVASLATGEIRRSTRARMVIARGGLRGFYPRLGGLAVSIGFGILALTIALFFVLPRTAHAALSRMVSERYHLPGFSAEVRLGDVGRILTRATPAMHVRIVGEQHSERLKWRGMALTHFDGKRWTAPQDGNRAIPIASGRVILGTDEQRRRSGRRITYEVLLETISSDALFLTGVPEVLWIDSPSVLLSGDGAYRLAGAPQQRLRYGALSFLDGAWIESRTDAPPDRKRYLQLPVLDRRIEDLARQVAAQAPSDEAKALAVAQYLRTAFGYTTELPSQESSDPLAQFLFERRRGHCEYFASAMAVMLRTLGIPSRLATGFDGGVLNPITGWYVVRASDAHSWVEAWIESRGWVTLDPTPAREAARHGLWSTLAFYSDAAEMFWQEWVVGYDFSRQLALATKMHSSGQLFGSQWLDSVRSGWLKSQAATMRVVRPYSGVLMVLLVFLVVMGFVIPKALRWRAARLRVDSVRRGDAIASDATLLYARMSSLLRHRGHPKPAWMTPGEFARGLPPSEASDLVRNFTSAYHELRYGGRREAATRMLALLERLEHAPDTGRRAAPVS